MKKILAFIVISLLISSPAMATITYTNTITTGPYSVGGQSMETVGELNLAGTYATGGFTVTPGSFGLSHIQSFLVQGEDGYLFWYNSSTGKVMVFQTGAGSGTITVTGAAYTPAGTVSQPTFTGTGATITPTAALDTAPVFTGTNATISPTAALSGAPTFTGTPMTTTVTLEDGTTGNPVYYDSGSGKFYVTGGGTVTTETFTPAGTNSTPSITVTGASYTPAGSVTGPAITVTGAAYTPAGTVSQPTFTGTGATISPTATFTGTGAGPLVEVTDGTSLAAVDKVNYRVTGW